MNIFHSPTGAGFIDVDKTGFGELRILIENGDKRASHVFTASEVRPFLDALNREFIYTRSDTQLELARLKRDVADLRMQLGLPIIYKP